MINYGNSIQVLGFIALFFSLLAITKVDMKKFRWLHLSSCILYLIYGLSISAFPIVTGAILFSGIHIFQLKKIYSNNDKV